MNFEEYLRPRLEGRRFEKHSIPLDVLRDLAALEDLIKEVARWRYFQENEGRSRLPRGFSEKVVLTLTAVEEGSAIPVLALMFASLFPPAEQVFYEQAREAIISAVRAAERNESPTRFLPANALAFFNRFGRNLRDGEAIVLAPDNPDAPARLTKDVRRRLVLASKEIKEIAEEIEIRGVIHEADQSTKTFQITLADGSKINGPITAAHRKNIFEAFNAYDKRAKIAIRGVGKFSRNQRLQSIESVDETTMLDPLDIPARFDELKLLRNGWLDGDGVPPSSEGLDWLISTMADKYPDLLPLPYAYPLPEGGIQFEWSLGSHEVSLDLDLEKKTGEWHAWDRNADKEEDISINLKDDKDWEFVIGRLTEMGDEK
jgi:hypothetical protein